MNQIECNLCHSVNLVLLNARDENVRTEIYICSNCNSLISKTDYQTDNFKIFDPSSAKEYVDAEAKKLNLDNSSLVLHIGSEDGSLLKLFKARSIPCFGFEPDNALAQKAIDRNVKTINDDFGIKHAWELIGETNSITNGQKIDLVIANEIVDKGLETQEVLEAVRIVLSENGSITFVENWIGNVHKDFNLVSNQTFISTLGLSDQLAQHDLEVVDVAPFANTRKLMWTVRPRSLFSVSPSVTEILGREQLAGFDSMQGTVEYFENKIKID